MKLPKGTLTDDVTELKRYALELERALAAEREALAGLVSIIDKAGLLNLSNGVQLGATSWYVKASDAMDYARELLRSRAPEPQAVTIRRRIPTRCALCGIDTDALMDRVWVEPKSGEDSSPMYRRAWICEDCMVVHWAELANRPEPQADGDGGK